jgi:hypothetical protein
MTNQKRIAIKITPEMLAQPAFGRFIDKYESTESYASRRAQLINVFQAGVLMTEAGLQHAFMFLDTEAYAAASVPQKQRMILEALSLRMGISSIRQEEPVLPPAQNQKIEPEPVREAEKEQTPLPDYDTQPADRDPAPKIPVAKLKKFESFGGV